MDNNTAKFEQWCIVELFGHQRIAGKCTEQNIAGTNMLRVDVPETKNQPAFTKYYGSAAIYAINPVDEATARIAADSIQAAPVTIWQAEAFAEKLREKMTGLPAANRSDEIDDIDMEDGPFS
ncbi:MAG: hypothetical protein KGO82_16555 [Bacteroidota bacterium]|nr:hypothetical protein [Bacteroidota bacterium]